jgi:capsular exopolysaccharide synthesis family protein
MSTELHQPTRSLDEAPQAAATLTRIVRFLHVVRVRKGLLFTSLFVAVLLAGLYYATAPRLYESNSRLYVLQMGSNVLDEAIESQGGVRENMANYQGVLTSDVVLEEVLQKLPAKHRVDLKDVPRDKWIAAIRKQLGVSAPRRTNLIDVRYRSRDPQAAAAIVNHVVDSYLKLMREIHKSSASEDVEFLTRKREKLDEEMRAINSELIMLKRQMQIISGPDNQTINPAAERLQELNKHLIDAMNRTREARSTMQAIREAAARGEDIHQFALQQIEVVGKEVFMRQMGLNPQDSWLDGRTRQQLINDQVAYKNDSAELGPNHPRMQMLAARIWERQKWLAERPAKISSQMIHLAKTRLTPTLLNMSAQKLRYAELREQALRDEFNSESQVVSSFEALMGRIRLLNFDLARKRELAIALATRISRTDLGKERGGLRTKIVSQPKVAKAPVSPRLLVVALVALVGGLGTGLGMIYVLDYFDDRFRSPEELQVQAGLPVLAIVGELPGDSESVGLESVRTFDEPNGSESEAFRTLRTALTFSSEPTTRLVVTSTEPGDGKTTVLVNLAVAFAQSGKRTLVIDADMRRPGLTALMDLRGQQGLSTILRSELPLETATTPNVLTTPLDMLDVIPSGPRPVNPAELLHGTRFSELLAWAESVYDQILIDAPPALAVTDAAIISRQVDGALLVVRPDKNRRRMVVRVTESLAGVGANVLGAVINHVTAEAGQDYYGYGYGYQYDGGEAAVESTGPLQQAA